MASTEGGTAHGRPGRPRVHPKGSSGNRTLLRGVDVFKSFIRLGAPATLSEIGRAVGMSPGRTHRYLEALVESELLRFDDAAGKYRLGPAALEIGSAALSAIDPVQLSSAMLRELTDATGLASHLSVWGSSGPTVIRWEQGSLESAMRIREGQLLGMLTTSTGQIFLTYMNEERVAPFVLRDMNEWNRKAPVQKRFNKTKIRSLQTTIRERGIARAIGMRNPQVAALSSPIFDRDGLAMSITISGIENTFDASFDGAVALRLKDTAARISRSLGGASTP
jgi:DNA-binding IclR family transcriptional regulator